MSKIDRSNLEAIAATTIPMLRRLVQNRNEILTGGIDAFEAATMAAVGADGDAEHVGYMQDLLLSLLGMMTAASAEMARACVDMTQGSALEALVRSHLYDPNPDGTLVLTRGPVAIGSSDDDGNGWLN